MVETMKAKRKLLITLILVIGVIGYAATSFYFWYQATYFVKTNNAYVRSAATADVTTGLTAKLVEWRAAPGTQVEKGEVIGSLSRAGLSDERRDDALIRAPISGTVLVQLFQPGEVVTKGAIITEIADLSRRQVLAYIDETEVFKLAQGDPADISIDGNLGKVYHGIVTDIGDATAFEKFGGIASTGGTFTKKVQKVPVTVDFKENPDARVLLGMNAAIRIETH